MKTQSVSLATLMGGAAVEMFDAALAAVADNIMDTNTEPTAVRKVTLEVIIRPHATREVADYDVRVTTKPAQEKAQQAVFYIGRTKDGTVLSERDHKQPNMFEKQEEAEVQG